MEMGEVETREEEERLLERISLVECRIQPWWRREIGSSVG